MDAQEQAQDLWLTFYELLPDGVYSNEAAKQEAKKFALIAANEAEKAEYNVLVKFGFVSPSYKSSYWKQIKQEIENI